MVCYEDTWTVHLAGRVWPGAKHLTVETLNAPTVVVAGNRSAPHNLVFVNLKERSPTSNHPFIVVVDPTAHPVPVVVSIGYIRQYANLSGKRVLWP